MYYIQLYSDSYTPIIGITEVDSANIPRPGDVIEHGDDSPYASFLVFDVTHILNKGRCMTVVRAREAAREDRQYNFIENGYLVPSEEFRHGDLFVSMEEWVAVEDKLPRYKYYER